MKKFVSKLAALSLIFTAVLVYADGLKVVVTTSHLCSLARTATGDKAQVTSLIPGGSCPGHFDMEPASAKEIAEADVFISHEWEKRFDGIIKGINNEKLVRKYAQTKGSWMVPEVNMLAADEMLAILSVLDKNNAEYYKQNIENYKKQVNAEAGKIQKRSYRYKSRPVVCAAHQADFVKWLGFNVIASYGSMEELNVKEMAGVVKKAKDAGALLVIDNLQSGPEAGLQIAKDLGISHITLTNFPENDSYPKTLAENSQKVLEAVSSTAKP